ncbi:hypothetical protein INS49_013374 [Diaporthe citri]|uniref:uncharacterized protein n=1 Tax=Diaporthe citri TaxID=83186 RepID=UPI001C7ECDBE|nr:uncharacterized protein INS49_013374 [Diaporthe citri]KAG6357497.1 hypothetical protein INS49_013374 [Diaporthe citri]
MPSRRTAQNSQPAWAELSRRGAAEILKVEQVSKDLFVLTLTRRNKSNLLAEGIDRLDSGREEAGLILYNLQTWAPDVAERFQPRTSDVILDTPFRLICSSPSGIPFDGAFAIRQYLAISYSWHSTDWNCPGTPHSAPEPGGLWPIGKRFADAILGLRGHPREGIWMDQICIDQDNDDEKQRAIACMDIVYKSCRRLVVLLEDVELTDDEVALCRRYDVPDLRFNIGAQRTDSETAVLISLFDKVARARWWKRAWCFHEFVVGEPWSNKRHQEVHNTVFVLGHGVDKTISIQWLTLHSILATVVIEVDHDTPDSVYVSPILSGLDDRTSPLRDSPDRKAGATRASFMGRFNSVAQTKCLKAGDRLSVCINLLGLGLAYVRGEEPTEDEVYYLAVMLALAAGEKAPLSFAYVEPLMLGGTQSWLMRPITATDTTLRKFTLGDMEGIHSISPDRLELDLVFFRHSFESPTEEELSKTFTVFPDAIKSTPPPLKRIGPNPMQGHRPDEELEKPRRQFLASVIAGGRGLASRLWAQLERDVVKYNYNTGIFADFQSNQDLRSSAESLMKLLTCDGLKEDNSEDNFTVEAALAFLTWITDPRSIYWISWSTSRAACSRDGEQALTTGFSATKNFWSMITDETTPVVVAVPTDLLEVDCSLTRAWVLVQVGGEQEEVAWKVVAKCLLLGNTDLAKEVRKTENGEHSEAAVELKKRQVVLG